MRTYLASCLCAAALLAAGPLAQAEITSWSCTDDGDGAIVMEDSLATWAQLADENGIPAYELNVYGSQYAAPAHVEGHFGTDSVEDPIVWIIETVDNKTTFPWTGYIIDIGMPQDFDILSAMGPADWDYSITQPVPGTIPNGGPGYVGRIEYTAGTPILIGESGDFGFKIAFEGSVDFCTEQTPTPEPASLSLLGLGVLALVRRRVA